MEGASDEEEGGMELKEFLHAQTHSIPLDYDIAVQRNAVMSPRAAPVAASTNSSPTSSSSSDMTQPLQRNRRNRKTDTGDAATLAESYIPNVVSVSYPSSIEGEYSPGSLRGEGVIDD